MPILEICKAATWSNPLTSVKDYALDMAARADAKFRRQYYSHCSTNVTGTPHSHHPEDTDTFSKKNTDSNCGSLRCSSQCGSHNLPYIPGFQSPPQHWLWIVGELIEADGSPALYALVWEHEVAQDICIVPKDTVVQRNSSSACIRHVWTNSGIHPDYSILKNHSYWMGSNHSFLAPVDLSWNVFYVRFSFTVRLG